MIDARRISRPGPQLLAAAAVIVAALSAMVVGRGNREMDLDEGYTRSLIALKPQALGHVLLHREMNGGLHTVLLHVLGFAGGQPSTLRYPSVLFVGIAALTIWFGVQRLTGSALSAMVALIFFCSNALIFDYAVEARTYALAALLAAAATFLLWRADSLNTWPQWLLYGVVLGLGVLAHLFVGLVAVAHVFWLLTSAPRRWVRWVAAYGLASVVALPVLAFVLVGGPSAGQLPDTPGLGIGGYVSAALSVVVGQAQGERLLQVALLAALAVPVVAAVRSVNQRPVRLALLVSVFPMVGAFIASGAAHFFSPRYMIVSVPGFALLVGLGLTELRRSLRAPAAITLGILLVSGAAIHREHLGGEIGWASSAAYVRDHAKPGDTVMTLVPYEQHVMAYYFSRDGLALTPALDTDGRGFLRQSVYSPRTCPPSGASGDIWLLSSMTAAYDAGAHLVATCAHKRLVAHTAFGAVKVYRLYN